MHSTHSRARRGGRTIQRVAPLVAAAVASGALAGPALAQAPSPLTVNAVKDSIIATGLPFGATTLQVKRPDAITGAPVVIGQFAGFAFPLVPFSVNTTTPTPFNPGGDCWQKGSLTLPGGVGLTPDIRPGDTVAVTNGPSVTVPADAEADGGPGGPIAGCKPISAWGQNSVTAATGDSGTDLSVSGNAQLLSTGASVTATDGQAVTTPVDATLAADGTWSATIPAAELAKLADGPVTVNGVFAVPDVSTGAAAHIAGAPLSAQKTTVAGAPEITPDGSAPAPAPAPAAPAATVGRLTSIRTTARISLAHALKGGIHTSFIVPAGAKVVRVRLARGGKTTAYVKFLAAAKPGTRQTVKLTGSTLSRKLRSGTYTLSVMAGPSRTQLGQAVKSNVTVR
jgi:hypothetical protein